MTLYDVNTGRGRMRELYAAVPGLRKSLLGSYGELLWIALTYTNLCELLAKRFGEQYHHLQRRRAASKGSSLRSSTDSLAASGGGSNPALACSLPMHDGPTSSSNGNNVEEIVTFNINAGDDLPNGSEVEDEERGDGQVQRNKKRSISIDSNASDFIRSELDPSSYASGGLANTHFQQRVINVCGLISLTCEIGELLIT